MVTVNVTIQVRTGDQLWQSLVTALRRRVPSSKADGASGTSIRMPHRILKSATELSRLIQSEVEAQIVREL